MNHPARPADELSATLRRLRREAELSGMEAARRAGYSQPKISRWETGRQVPTSDQVRTLCRLYRADPDTRRRLLTLATDLRAEQRSARVVLQAGTARQQQRIGRLEQASSLIRAIQPAMVFGLLQTADYTRATGSRDMSGDALEAFVAARRERQALLDTGCRFEMVLTEGALRWQVGSPQLMADQLDVLADATQRPNLALGVIPWTRPVWSPMMHSFHLFDARAAIVATEIAVAVVTDSVDVSDLEKRYSGYAELAEFGPAARDVFARLAAEYRTLG